jgi:hypothetical protein
VRTQLVVDKKPYWFELIEDTLFFYNKEDEDEDRYSFHCTSILEEVIEQVDVECLAEIVLVAYLRGFEIGLHHAVNQLETCAKEVKQLKP